MKKWYVLILVISLGGMLLGCGNNGANLDTTPSSSTSPSSTANAEPSSTPSANTDSEELPQTRIYKDAMDREVEIPVRPERVVTISMTGEMALLGKKPVGAADNWLKFMSEEEQAGIVNLGQLPGNMESIVSLEPDLIITPAQVSKAESIEAYSKIAPTVVVPFFGDALDRFRIAGDLMGMSDEANAWIESYLKKGEETRKKLAPVVQDGQTGIVIQFSNRSMFIFPASTYPTVYETLGLKAPVEDVYTITQGMQITEESLPEFAADHIFLVTTFGDKAYVDEVLKGPIWSNLPAVKDDRVYVLGDRISAGDAPALDWSLDEIVRLMSK
ncbi:ABC transporter substrate-binding protein [Paenibacillus sp. strain BS8-2]